MSDTASTRKTIEDILFLYFGSGLASKLALEKIVPLVEACEPPVFKAAVDIAAEDYSSRLINYPGEPVIYHRRVQEAFKAGAEWKENN